MKSHEHLSKISERGGDEYRQHVEDKLSAIEARDRGNKKHEALGDIEQPEAAELLDFIARCNMDAHAELGNLASNDEVWQRAMAVASGEITRASEDEANSALTKEMMKGLFAMGLLSSQLDTMAAVYAKENCPQVIRDFIEHGSSYVLELAGEAINESKDSGLVGLVQARESDTVTGIPIGSQVTQVLYERKKARAQEHKQAIIANAERNSPEQNDADLAALIERQEDRTRRVHTEHDNPGSAIIDIDNDTEAVQGKLILQTGNYSNEVANSYIRMLREKSDYESSLASNPYTASRRKREKVRGRDALMQELSIIPVDRLQSMYFSAKDKEGGALRYMVRQGIEDYNGTGAHGHNKLIEKIYSTKGYHLANDERARRDPLLKKKLETPLGYLEFAVPVEQPTDKAEYAEFTQALRDNSEILFRKLGLPESVTDGLRRSINEKTMMKGQDGFTARGEDRCVDSRQLRRELKTIMDAVETIGVDNVTKLAEICGIINIQNYSPEQLERMVQFVDGDQELIDHLGRGDVTAVLIDATGDHNGAMKDASKDFDKPSGRSLFFEVNQPSDLYRHMAKLRRTGIAPSTLIIGVHGSPGAMHFGDAAGRFVLTNANGDEQRQNYEALGIPRMIVGEATGLGRLAQDYLQPSKGIDDDESQVGQVNIILKSCSQAVPRPVRRVEYGIGTERNESMAEALSQKMGSSVNVFGADAVVSSGLGQDERSLQYYDEGKKADALKHTTDERGNVVIIRQETVPLYRANSAQSEVA